MISLRTCHLFNKANLLNNNLSPNKWISSITIPMYGFALLVPMQMKLKNTLKSVRFVRQKDKCDLNQFCND